jgi:hypothetical protein
MTAVVPAGQSAEPITEAPLRALARQASRDSKGDPTELILGLDRRVRERWGDFESFPLSIVREPDLLVTVSAPYMSFRRSVVDVLRSGRSIDKATWAGAVVVAITPRGLAAPDIELVTVARNGRPVPPIRSALRPMTFSNGTGDEGVIHAGEVHFAASVVSPGAAVVLTLVPRDRAPIVYTFTDAELGTLR